MPSVHGLQPPGVFTVGAPPGLGGVANGFGYFPGAQTTHQTSLGPSSTYHSQNLDEVLRAKTAEYSAPAGVVPNMVPWQCSDYLPLPSLLGHIQAQSQCLDSIMPAFDCQQAPPAPFKPNAVSVVKATTPSAPGAKPNRDVCETLGSVGHPHRCAKPCRYVKRKGGCKDGAQCLNCHICFWRRDECKKVKACPVPNVVEAQSSLKAIAGVDNPGFEKITTLCSVGTQGHPHNCASPCRYVRRKTGCRNGAACVDCHACLWSRNAPNDGDSSGSVQEEAEDIFFDESRETLQSLIHLLIQNKEAAHSTTIDA